MTIKPEETATIVAGGRRFDDWESVSVQHRWADPNPIFRFTATERDPIPNLWERLQFRPGDECAIYLGGILAIAGVILLRQTAYDATSHGVMLQGVGVTWYAARGSVMDKDGNFDGQTFEQVARKVIAPFGVGVKVIGTLNATPFKKLQVEPGETVWDFLERIARPRGIVMGSNHRGNFLLIDNHRSQVAAELIEGDNILKCQATISQEAMYSDYVVRAQSPANDEKYGPAAAEMEAHIAGTAKRYSPILTPAEQPVWNPAEVSQRAKNEYVWHEGTIINANVTVQGWMMPGGGLWRAGDLVAFISPMTTLNMGLKIQNVTFTQDSQSGTLTTLELVAPWLLKDYGDYNVGRPGAPPPPKDDDAKTNTQPPASPTAATVPDPYPEQLISA